VGSEQCGEQCGESTLLLKALERFEVSLDGGEGVLERAGRLAPKQPSALSEKFPVWTLGGRRIAAAIAVAAAGAAAGASAAAALALALALTAHRLGGGGLASPHLDAADGLAQQRRRLLSQPLLTRRLERLRLRRGHRLRRELLDRCGTIGFIRRARERAPGRERVEGAVVSACMQGRSSVAINVPGRERVEKARIRRRAAAHRAARAERPRTRRLGLD